MSELISVGLDVGTTTTQMVVSKLTAENRASAFSVPRMEITGRQILYQSPIHFTPIIRDERIDGAGIRAIVECRLRHRGTCTGCNRYGEELRSRGSIRGEHRSNVRSNT